MLRRVTAVTNEEQDTMKVKDLWIEQNLKHEIPTTDPKIAHENCGFFRSARAWAKLLAEADQSDAEYIAFLEDKLKTARAIVQARERAGKYLPKGEL
jgi:hypothetical protein